MPLLMLFAAWVAGIFVGVQWAESEVVKDRIRKAWRLGVAEGGKAMWGKRITVACSDNKTVVEGTIVSVNGVGESEAEAAERLIRETRERAP